ncbi:MAG: hypothetical protein AB7I42_24270 [Bradyrhizobium sp.]|uniref:hypothetical protein n=1 Tax=Bradyrhizobium sp. TaxID=376 RepID=UPI003D111103
MRKFFGFGSVAVGTDKTLITLNATAAVRPRIYEIMIGCKATPADAASHFTVGRITALGTEGSGFTPVELDPANPAAIADFGVGVFSVEPTYTANKELWSCSMNQRATVRWIANRESDMLVAPATANNGLGLKSKTSTVTTAHEASIYYEE